MVEEIPVPLHDEHLFLFAPIPQLPVPLQKVHFPLTFPVPLHVGHFLEIMSRTAVGLHPLASHARGAVSKVQRTVLRSGECMGDGLRYD
jgi:hypothetical protein